VLQERFDQQQDVLPPLRRQVDGDHVEPIKEIRTEGGFPHLLFEVPVGRRHDANIHRNGLGGSHRNRFPFLQYLEQLDLQ
jgi:hypothetical protein